MQKEQKEEKEEEDNNDGDLVGRKEPQGEPTSHCQGRYRWGDRENVFGFFFSYAAQVQTEKLIHTEGLVIVDIYCEWCFSAITIVTTNADGIVKNSNYKGVGPAP